MSKSLPNFLMVGTAKAATTSIHAYLNQHPDVFMSEKKEPCFFSFYDELSPQFTDSIPVDYVHSLSAYLALFEQAMDYKIRGESSTPYLFFYDKTIENIKKIIPNYRSVKILIMLRNPVDRAYSQYMMRVRDVFEDLSFEEALRAEKTRIEAHAHFDSFYVERGFYYKQVKAYLENFDQVKVLFYEDFKADPQGVLTEILDFLEVDRVVLQTSKRENVSGVPRLKFMSQLVLSRSKVKKKLANLLPYTLKAPLLNAYRKLNFKQPPAMKPETREQLKALYREDVMKLEKLLHKDLSNWYR